MVSLQGKLADSKVNSQPVRFAAQNDGVRDVDTEQMFRLIDSVLSFEACLYHQVLPLALEGSRLRLGMVNPEDTAAVDYVYRILSYMNCSLVRQPIAADAHQTMLSAYLNYTGTSKPATMRVRSLAVGHPAAETANKRVKQGTAKADIDSQATLILTETETLDSQSANRADSHILDDQTKEAPSDALQTHPTVEVTSEPTSQAPELPPSPLASPNSNLSVLEVQAAYLSSPVEVLATLPPKNLLQELLARVRAGGIGRLYFERQSPQQGRILWSQNGVLQSVLEELPLTAFKGVIDELKLLTNLDLIPVQEPKQVEIERLYEQNRLLLRLRVMPGTHGEEATLQVLRGAALKFYQQQQLARLSQDALGIANQLQRKLDELRERVQLNPSLNAGQLDALPALNQLLESVDQQLEALKHLSH